MNKIKMGSICSIFNQSKTVYIIDDENETVSFGKKRLRYLHPFTFKSLGLGYGKDFLNVYYRGNEIENAHPPSFVVDNLGNAYDRSHMYVEGKPDDPPVEYIDFNSH